MNKEYIDKILSQLKNGEIEVNQASELLKTLPYAELGYAKVDHHRTLRRGYPEVIFGAGKTPEHIKGIVANMVHSTDCNILVTRCSKEASEQVLSICPTAEYHPLSKALVVKQKEFTKTESYIAVVTAGTSDIPIAEEAQITAEILGNKVESIFDVGVAGIHRLYDQVDKLRGAKVLIVIAGMEGALPSVVGGLVDKPIIAVPTSVGYGAAFGGIAALLGMLTSCTSGISVVNIDNGFGAAYQASLINQL